MKQRFTQFMQGRYGSDGFNRLICIMALIFLLCGMLLDGWMLTWLSAGLLAFAYYRMFSRNTTRRAQENAAYYQLQHMITGGLRTRLGAWNAKMRTRAAQRKTHRFFRCPQCGQELRVPRGRGKIEISCPKCHKTFLGKS